MPPKKDPNKPKGRTSAYAFYVQDRRQMCRERGEEVEFAPFSKRCAEEWKKMDDDAKAKYVKLGEEDKERYLAEKAAYQQDDDGGRRRKKKKKDPNMPKRSKSAFIFFSSAYRPELKKANPSASIGDLSKILGEKWKTVDKSEKEKFEEMAREDRERYTAEMDQYRSGEYLAGGDDEVEDSDED